LDRIVGFALGDEAADRLLAAQRHMAGGTLLAARLALESAGVAVNLGGGFHHAFADKGERFCAYNDVAVSVSVLREAGRRRPILVVDLDLHDGDGTRCLFAQDESVHTYSVHNHTSWEGVAREATVIELGDAVKDETYLDAVESTLPGVFSRFRPGLVFYLAGCDPAVDDQIGDWRISAEALLARDRRVVSLAREGKQPVPLIVVLAGGYGANAWRYSARFFSVLLSRGQAIEPPTNEEMTLARFRRIARELRPPQLTGEPVGEDFGLTEADLGGLFGGPRRPRRYLGYYSLQGVELAFERVGLLERLRRMGFATPTLEMDLDNPAGDTLRLWSDAARRALLMELRTRIDRTAVTGLALLRIEWLLLQNPRAQFTAERPRLPGQTHPGLGLLPDIMGLLVLACDRLHLDGLLFVPAHYHTASQGRKTLRFLDPAHEGLFRALHAGLAGLPLAEATRAVDEGRVYDEATGERLAWPNMPMVLPVSDQLAARVSGDAYENAAEAARARYRFRCSVILARH
jgi:acetoin utilization deacetylase AcuC-like enzyme